MVTHLTHLEDLYLLEGMEAIVGISQSLATDAHISLKWDGSPAIVVGCDGYLGGKFIATKGFFNRSSVVYTSEAEVNQIPNEGLREKMLAIWNKIAWQDIHEGSIYQGDLLFYDHSHPYESTTDELGRRRFQPNVVHYAANGVDSDMGIAWHTQLKGTEPLKLERIWQPESILNPNHISVFRASAIVPIERKHTRYAPRPFLVEYMHWCVRNKLPHRIDIECIYIFWKLRVDAHISKLTTARGIKDATKEWEVLLREVKELPLQQMDKDLQDILNWKSDLLCELSETAQAQIGVRGWVNNTEAHEGFVIKTPTQMVKVVDRPIFSAANFEAHK